MEKVNCGFCGIAFLETADKCPVCGFPRKIQNASKSADVLLDDEFESRFGKGGSPLVPDREKRMENVQKNRNSTLSRLAEMLQAIGKS